MIIFTDEQRVNPLALVVDDDISLRMVICAALRKFGLDVIEADSGVTAVEQFKSAKPDIVLLDVVMPEMNGFDACEKIRTFPEGQFVQVLMVTGLEDTESTKTAFEKGANGFVTKPLNLIMLGQRVSYMLRAGAAFRELHINRNRLAKTQELAKIGNWQINLRTNEFNCSQEARQLLGLKRDAGRDGIDSFLATIIPKDRIHVKDALEKAISQREGMSSHYRIRHTDGSIRYILKKAEIILDEQARPAMMLGIVQDVTQLKKAENEIQILAYSDSLTGLANRILFMDRLEQAILDATRKENYFAVMFLDLDHFKRINDTLGHQIGDLLLKKVAETIQASIRKTDSATWMGAGTELQHPVIARLGGDEFTILVPDLNDPGYAAVVARRLLTSVPMTHNLNGHEVSINTSIGISIFPDDGREPEGLLKNADTAMYEAKEKGRNGYQFFRQAMNRDAAERFAIGMDLRKALIKEEFQLVYQPQVEMKTRRVVGAEALIRWHHPLRGILTPDKFISIAEESSIIIDINRWVLKNACEQARRWAENGLDAMRMSVNVSGYKLGSQNLVESIDHILGQVAVEPSMIEIEMTENLMMRNTRTNISTLNEIKNRRMRIALDDFGTGYSSLSYLTSFPVDTIKIDQSFVLDDDRREKNTAIIKAITAMGHSLGKKVVTEGIETRGQYDWIREIGCDEAQGYYFSRPVDADSIIDLLKKGFL